MTMRCSHGIVICVAILLVAALRNSGTDIIGRSVEISCEGWNMMVGNATMAVAGCCQPPLMYCHHSAGYLCCYNVGCCSA